MSPELLRMAKRAALPIHVASWSDGTFWIERPRYGRKHGEWIGCRADTPAQAKAAYFEAVESLTPNPDTSPSLVSGAADLSASISPGRVS